MEETLPARNPHDYRDYLRASFLKKQLKNNKFSLRSFAKMIGMQPSFLSMVMNGKRELSIDNAYQVADKLGLSKKETQAFRLLVQLQKANSEQQRLQLLKDLKKTAHEPSTYRDLTLDQFQIIAEWYYAPLQLLVDLAGFEWSELNAARALGISTTEVKEALKRLAALEMIVIEPGKNAPTRIPDVCMIRPKGHQEALKKYHKAMLQKTTAAQDEQHPDIRYTGTTTLALSLEQLQKCRNLLNQTVKELGKICEEPAQRKDVFHVNLNLIQLTKPYLKLQESNQ